MKFKYSFWLLLLIPIICAIIFVYFHRLAGIAFIIFIANACLSLIIGISTFKNHRVTGSILIIIGMVTMFWLYNALSSSGYGPRGRYNAAVKANLSNIRAEANLIYTNAIPNSYENICNEVPVKKLIDAASYSAKSVACFDDNDSYVVVAEFRDRGESTHWCTDSNGTSKSINKNEYRSITSSDILCPL